MKRNILRLLSDLDCRLTVVPAMTGAAEAESLAATGSVPGTLLGSLGGSTNGSRNQAAVAQFTSSVPAGVSTTASTGAARVGQLDVLWFSGSPAFPHAIS